MDSSRCSIYQNGNVVYIVPGNDGNNNANWGLGSIGNNNENWGLGFIDQTVWATEEDYGFRNTNASVDVNSNFNGRQIYTGSGSESPYKKSRISQPGDVQPTNRSKVMAKMFFKTKLCHKFRYGNCPNVTNCNFAHSIEELRKLTPNEEELIASYKEEQAANELKEFYIPSQSSSRGRHCKMFMSKEGCPYGDYCLLLHDERARDRESVTISLGPGSRDKYGGGASGGSGGVRSSTLKPVKWKTKNCNTWELTGQCSYGDKCNFAHGTTELQRYGGGFAKSEGKKISSPLDVKQEMVSSKSPSVPFVGSYHRGVPSQRVPMVPMAEPIPKKKWKPKDKINLVYGDWIEDLV